MGWHVVQKLVDGTGVHSTLIGKYWINSFFLLRFQDTWSDSQSNFVCNTKSPGCKNVCFNAFSPIAPTRFWAFQLLAVSVMTIIFNVYTTHKLALVTKAIRKKRIWKEKQKAKLKEAGKASGGNEKSKGKEYKQKKSKDDEDDKVVATKLQEDHPSKLFLAYFSMVFSRLLVEVGFMIGQYNLYAFKFVVPELWQCRHWPCPNAVDCFVSRPKEKTIMLCILYATGCIMVLLNIIELYNIGGNLSKAWKTRHQDVTKEVFGDEIVPMFDGAAGGVRTWGPAGVYEVPSRGYPDVVGIPRMYVAGQPGRKRGQKSVYHKQKNEEYIYT
ncbi:gap junction beta-2 protein-like [Clavelina lepadiformis]|uniref:gap junction beta-2 protein-like n=1 Tax=Clavelina lepadiformis TaxID=159417 RepID=UPI0040427786